MKPDERWACAQQAISPTVRQRLKSSRLLLLILAIVLVLGMYVYFSDFANPRLHQRGTLSLGLLLGLLIEWLFTRFLPTILLISAVIAIGIYLMRLSSRR